jgi:hypothetical protein
MAARPSCILLRHLPVGTTCSHLQAEDIFLQKTSSFLQKHLSLYLFYLPLAQEWVLIGGICWFIVFHCYPYPPIRRTDKTLLGD